MIAQCIPDEDEVIMQNMRKNFLRPSNVIRLTSQNILPNVFTEAVTPLVDVMDA
jgi:hypothetical protein